MSSGHYNPEKRAWRGRSYKKVGKTVRDLKLDASNDRDEVDSNQEEAMRSIIANIVEIVVYDVISTHDLTEGRTPKFVAGTFLTMNEAKEAGKGKYIMGSDCPVKKRLAKVVMDDDGNTWLLGEAVKLVAEKD